MSFCHTQHPRESWSDASLLQLVDTQLYSKKRNIEFLQTTFEILSHVIESSFMNGDIENIWRKHLKDLQEKGDTRPKATDQQCLKINIVVDGDTVAKTIEPKPFELHDDTLVECQTSEDLALDSLYLLAELGEAEVLSPPLQAERSLGYGSSEFQLVHGGDLSDLFSNSDLSCDPVH